MNNFVHTTYPVFEDLARSSSPIIRHRVVISCGSLDLEHAGQHVRLAPFGVTSSAVADVPSIVGRDDILTGLRMVHIGVVVREEAVEEPVEDAGHEEAVDVAYREAVGCVSVLMGERKELQLTDVARQR